MVRQQLVTVKAGGDDAGGPLNDIGRIICYAIDPGYETSAIVAWDGTMILEHAIERNESVLDYLRHEAPYAHGPLVIEMIESFGMAVGRTTFETVFWSGRFAEAWHPHRVDRITRREVKLHLCGHARATDSNIKQAIVDRFGPSTENAIGRKATPGPLYGIKQHCWSALAVALTWHDTRRSATAATGF